MSEVTPKQRQEYFEECARYIVEFEEDDWKDQIYYHNVTVEDHIFAKAYRALHGEEAFDEKCADLEEEMKKWKK